MTTRRIHAIACACWLVFLWGLSTASPAQTPTYVQAQQALQSGQLETAFRTFQALAQGGDAPSQFQLSLLYGSGRGVAPNAQLARQWLMRAAAGRHGEALSNLGGDYTREIGRAHV